MKWCPAPGCENAIEFAAGTSNYDVSCSCSRSFCWNVSSCCQNRLFNHFGFICGTCNKYMKFQCTEEAHRPVDCHTVAQWIRKNSAESENMNWYYSCSYFHQSCVYFHRIFMFNYHRSSVISLASTISYMTC